MSVGDAGGNALVWEPLTGAQTLIWASQLLHPAAPLYNMAHLYDIRGEVDPDAFVTAFARLIDEVDALRTVVGSSDGMPRQRVVSSIDFVLPVVDLSMESDPTAASRAWAQARCEETLDLDGRLFDAALIKVGERRYGWYINQHHIVTDAWSTTVLFERMESLYRSVRHGQPPSGGAPLPYARYLEYERSARESHAASSPDEQGPDTLPAPRLYGRSATKDSTANKRLLHELTIEQSEELRQLAMRPGIRALTEDLSLFRLFATALFAYLYRVTGQSRLSVGAPAHNRVTAEFKRSVGLFMEVYPLEADVGDADTFETLHAKVVQATDRFMRSAKPGQSSAEVNRQMNTVLNFIRGNFGRFDDAPVQTEWLHPKHVDAEHHLRIHVHDFGATGRFTLLFDCNEDVLDEQYRSAVPKHFLRILDAMVLDWQQPIAGVGLLSERETADTIAVVNTSTSAGSVRDNVVTQFRKRVAADPAAVAMQEGHRQWTYGDLDRLTAEIAAAVEAGSVVGVCMARSPEAVLTMLGVLRAGAAYVPIDPAWPASRIEFVIEDAGCCFVVSDRPLESRVPTMRFDELDRPDTAAESIEIRTDDLAYVLYTSGSTGVPKGVMIEHGALANYVTWASEFYDRGRKLTFPLFSPLTFDLTVTSIYVPLVSGGSILVYPQPESPADLTFQQVFDDDAVDIVKLTPSHLALLPQRDFSTSRIRQLVLGGEDLTTALARRTHDLFGGQVLIHNEYGPTEATVGCVVHTYQPGADRNGSVPIGRPIDNMRAYVLDGAGQPVPFGVPGELWVAGAGVARGYAGRPDLTRERFMGNETVGEAIMYATGDLARVRPGGTIEYVGRRDDQVKIRGIRVELGEIEAAVADHPGVGAAAARVWERTADGSAADDRVYCSRCGMASDFPGISFDADRVCNQCRGYETYRDKARVYFKPMEDFEGILASARERSEPEYDCLALLSGGKDSTYMLCRLVDMGLRVLAFTLDNGYISDEAKGNIRRVAAELGVDHIFASTPAMNEIFVDSLQRHANVCQGCFKTIYTLSMQTAKEKGIPFIVTGLSRGQFFETRLTEDLFTELTVSSEQIDANVLEARKAYHRVDDAVHRLLDVSLFQDDRIFEEVRFVDFYRYCDVDLDELYAYLDQRVPWVRPSDTGRSTNCLINDVGIYFHRRTRGFHNYALPYSWDVRLGHKTRDQALEELDDDIDVAGVQRILSEIGFPEDVTDFESGRRLVAYYAAPVEIPMPELRSHAAEKLPRQLIPAQFVHLETIPLTANGKVDRAALPEPGTSRPDVDTVFLAPQSDAEVALAHIWEEVIGLDQVGIRDDFFELGGDSIMAIQIVARAHRAGLPITLNHLFDGPTVEHLAQAAEEARLESADRMEGPVALTPIQRWFFEQHSDNPGHFLQVAQVDLQGDVDLGVLEECLAVLADHHDALRQSFFFGKDGWRSMIAGEAVAPALDVSDVSVVDPDGRAFERQLHDGFDLSHAPLMRAGLLRGGDGASRLILVGHHLIVDAVSWLTLIDDLGHLYRERSSGLPVGLPAVTTSLGDWVEALAEGADSIDASPWFDVVSADASASLTGGPGKVHTAFGRAVWDETRTEALVSGASAWRIDVDELLVAALAMTLAELNGRPQQRVFLQGHGRESDDASFDVTMTLGWFTSLYPVLLNVGNRADLGEVAQSVRDELRRVSANARDYGVVRYLHPDPEVRSRSALLDHDHVVFSYLGRAAAVPAVEENHFRLSRPIQLVRGESMGPSFAAEVTGIIDSGRLVIGWISAIQDQTAVTDNAERLLEHLEALVDACASGLAHPPAAGNFRVAGVDETALDKLAAVLRSGGGDA